MSIIKEVNEMLGTDFKVIKWSNISKTAKLTKEFLQKYGDKIEWKYVFNQAYRYDFDIFEEFKEHLTDDSSWASAAYYASEDFIIKNIEEFDNRSLWEHISCRSLSEDFIRKYFKKLDIWFVLQHSKLSDEFIIDFYGHIKDNSAYCKVFENVQRSEEFIDKFNGGCWDTIVHYQKDLSENFLRRHSKDFNTCWDYVSTYQNPSIEFIRDFEDKFGDYGFHKLAIKRGFDKEFVTEFIDHLAFENVIIGNTMPKESQDILFNRIVEKYADKLSSRIVKMAF